jgi:hypothetical protein
MTKLDTGWILDMGQRGVYKDRYQLRKTSLRAIEKNKILNSNWVKFRSYYKCIPTMRAMQKGFGKQHVRFGRAVRHSWSPGLNFVSPSFNWSKKNNHSFFLFHLLSCLVLSCLVLSCLVLTSTLNLNLNS